MDKGEALRIARKYIEILSNRFVILQAFVFGSFARGTNHADSDIDIAIVVKDVSDIIDTRIEMMKMRRKIDLRIEPHPFADADFNNDNPVVHEIMKHGIQINV